MKRILIIVSAILAVLLVAVFTVPFLVPKAVYRAQIEQAATSALQRDVVLSGDVSVSVFPRIAASVSDVSVANPAGFAEPNMITAGELRGSVKWLPLLSRRVEVQEIAFIDASVNLQRLENGDVNWEFGAADTPQEDTPPSDGGFDASVGSAVLKNASLVYRDDQAGKTYEVKELNLDASMQALDKPLNAKASGLYQAQKFDMTVKLDSPSLLTASQSTTALIDMQTSLGKLRYDGSITLGDAGVLDGMLSMSSPDIAALVAFTGIEPPVNLAPLGAADIIAKVTGALMAPNIQFERMTLKSGLLEASYTGDVSLGATPTVDGALKVDLPNAGEFTHQLGLSIPAEDALERIQASGNVSGPADALTFSGLSLKHTGALLNAAYTGSAALAGDGRLEGDVSASSDSLRALLTAMDVELAPGETLQNFNTSGALSGTFKAFTLNNMDLTLDDLSGTGSVGLDLSNETPKITGDLVMPALNLTPFMGEQKVKEPSKTGIQPWSKEPLDLAGLSAVDADLNLETQKITIGDVELTDASIATKLKGGRLVADLSRFKAFNGNWNGKLIVNAQSGAPIMSFNMSGDNVIMSQMLGTLSGFDRLTGTGQFNVTAKATGNSIDEIMSALDGTVSTNLVDGALKGLNVTQLVRSAKSLQQAVTTGSLKNLDFASVLSPSAETDFSSFETVLSIKDGVANVDLMKLLNPVLGIDGTGSINLGGQNLDLRLATSIDKQGQGSGSVVQLNGIPVPVRLSGSWNNLKVTPDLSGVTSALKAELGNQLLDGILGGSKNTTEQTAPTTSSDESSTPPETLEDAAEKAARDALGDILGIKKKAPAPKEDDGSN